MFFKGCKTVAEVKSEYRRLAMLHHPDRGGDTRTMQDLVNAYHVALKRRDGETSRGTDDREHTYHYNERNETAATRIIDELLKLKMAGVEILLIGTWVWVEGETKQYRKLLGKAGLGLKWHSKRLMWYWSPGKYRKKRYSNMPTEDLKAYYGVKYFKDADEKPKRKSIAA